MKYFALAQICLIISLQLHGTLSQPNGFLQNKETNESTTQASSSETQQTTFERVVSFSKFTMELTTKNQTFVQKMQLIPMQSTNTGSIFFNLKNNSGNQRGWKISLNKGEGYELQNINENQMQLLKRIFNKNLGRLLLKSNKISKIKLFQPEQNSYCAFEISQLKNQCWRVDVYPKHLKRDTYKYIVHLKMCADSEEGQKKMRRFAYLLNNKELGKTSKE